MAGIGYEVNEAVPLRRKASISSQYTYILSVRINDLEQGLIRIKATGELVIVHEEKRCSRFPWPEDGSGYWFPRKVSARSLLGKKILRLGMRTPGFPIRSEPTPDKGQEESNNSWGKRVHQHRKRSHKPKRRKPRQAPDRW